MDYKLPSWPPLPFYFLLLPFSVGSHESMLRHPIFLYWSDAFEQGSQLAFINQQKDFYNLVVGRLDHLKAIGSDYLVKLSTGHIISQKAKYEITKFKEITLSTKGLPTCYKLYPSEASALLSLHAKEKMLRARITYITDILRLPIDIWFKNGQVSYEVSGEPQHVGPTYFIANLTPRSSIGTLMLYKPIKKVTPSMQLFTGTRLCRHITTNKRIGLILAHIYQYGDMPNEVCDLIATYVGVILTRIGCFKRAVFTTLAQPKRDLSKQQQLDLFAYCSWLFNDSQQLAWVATIHRQAHEAPLEKQGIFGSINYYPITKIFVIPLKPIETIGIKCSKSGKLLFQKIWPYQAQESICCLIS